MMKLIMENWRKFVAETERTKNYGDLYLFENDSIQKVSFYDRFTSLRESDEDFEIFLEQWEKSVDYIFNNLSEQEESNDAILRASTQAYMLLQRGGAAVGKVMNFAKKLKDKGALGKVGDVVLTGLIAAAGAVTINSLMQQGVDASEFQQAVAQVADAASAVDPNVAQAVEQVAQNPEAALEVMPQLDQAVEQSAQQLSQVDNEAVQQMAQEAEKVSQQIPEKDEFASMFEDALRQDRMQSDTGETGITNIEQSEQIDYWDYSDEDFQQEGWRDKVNDIFDKIFGRGHSKGRGFPIGDPEAWRETFEILDNTRGGEHGAWLQGAEGDMSRSEFKELISALDQQGVDKKVLRTLNRVYRQGKMQAFVGKLEDTILKLADYDDVADIRNWKAPAPEQMPF